MPSLDIILVEHRLPIKEGFEPYMQSKRRISATVVLKVKEEVESVFKARFIRMARHAEWLSNVVLEVKKNEKLWIYIDFRDTNKATPKGEYLMLIINALIDVAI